MFCTSEVLFRFFFFFRVLLFSWLQDGAVYWDYNATVEKNLINDWMQGVVPKLESLLSHTSVLIYNGQLDVILGPPLCLNALAKLNWAGASSFAAARKQIWKLPYAPNEVAGYIIESQNGNRTVGLTHATVRLAGHLVPGKFCFLFFASILTNPFRGCSRVRLRFGAAIRRKKRVELTRSCVIKLAFVPS
jgi:hypothetical protein